jgi:hypothetical protein
MVYSNVRRKHSFDGLAGFTRSLGSRPDSALAAHVEVLLAELEQVESLSDAVFWLGIAEQASRANSGK